MAVVSKSERYANPLALAGLIQPSPFLDHLVRFLGTVGGTDKVLMFVQYYSKIIIWFLNRYEKNSFFSRLLGNRKTSLAEKISNLANPVADFRILLRYYGLLPLIQYMISIEHNPPPNLNIIRLQNFFTILYYPLEHIWWLGAHKVIEISDETLNKIGLWSCRFWAAYVILQFWHLYEQFRLMEKRRIGILKKVDVDEEEIQREKQALKADNERMVRETIINIGYLPLTLHWSVQNSSCPDVGIGMFGTLAAVYQFIAAWKDSA